MQIVQVRLKNSTLPLIPSAIILGAALFLAALQAMFPSTYTPPHVTLVQEPSEAVVGLCLLSQDLANYFMVNAATSQPDHSGADSRGRQQEPTLFSILKLDPFKPPFDEAKKACDNLKHYNRNVKETVFQAGYKAVWQESRLHWESRRAFAILVQAAINGLITEDTRCIYMDWLERKNKGGTKKQANDGFHHVDWKQKCKGILPGL
ncbi:unnamed protein product [Clonostachys byssicola]|uniref:Uncharacterized protein n=1 Tax=Clonostachys byssicola TaxID=160290 RepID=A0A9N9Y0Q2_9HYPO|nr:unnamed protein product [Clonostachys byssicola]